MPRPIPMPVRGLHTTPLAIPRAIEPASILTALPFLSDPDQAWAVAHWTDSKPSGAAAVERRHSVYDAISESLNGISYDSHWRGARADQERSSGHNLDRAFLTAGIVKRVTAHLPVGPDIHAWARSCKEAEGAGERNWRTLRTYRAYLHAQKRAAFKIGMGLLDAAQAMLEGGLLGEAHLINGHGQHHPQRLLIRDAVLASEDLTIEEMAQILKSARHKRNNADDEEHPARSRRSEATEDTPLVFIHCRGVETDLNDKETVVLEGVDFRSIDTLEHCLTMISDRRSTVLGEAREILRNAYRKRMPQGGGVEGRRRTN